jgi:hypothetical protein
MNLQYYRIFNENTSQGIVGVLKPSTNKKKSIFKVNLEPSPYICAVDHIIEDGVANHVPNHPLSDWQQSTFDRMVFKIPKIVDGLIDHEYKISKDLEQLSYYLPNFIKVFEVKRNVKCFIPHKKLKYDYNPFEFFNCIRDVSIMEYIPSDKTFKSFIDNNGFNTCTNSLIHQIILALFIAQQEINFTHYDLHLDNILIRKCCPRTFFLYKFSYEEVIFTRLIQSEGYFPVIFDYGFAYSKGLENTSYNNSFFFTHRGYTSFMFDDVNDFKSLLIRLSYIHNCPSKFKKLAYDFFLDPSLPIKMCEKTGWIKIKKTQSIGRIVSDKIEKKIEFLSKDEPYKTNFIYKELDYIIDLLGILIKTPLGPNDFNMNNLNQVVKIFLKEWKKLDDCFGPMFEDDKLNIFKAILLAINNLIEEGFEQEELNHKFKLKLFEILDSYGNFILVKNLNCGKFLLSILELSNFIEHVAFKSVEYYNKNFKYDYSGWVLFDLIENTVNLKQPCIFEYNDKIVMFDCIDKTTLSINLEDKDELKALNMLKLKDQSAFLIKKFIPNRPLGDWQHPTEGWMV